MRTATLIVLCVQGFDLDHQPAALGSPNDAPRAGSERFIRDTPARTAQTSYALFGKPKPDRG